MTGGRFHQCKEGPSAVVGVRMLSERRCDMTMEGRCFRIGDRVETTNMQMLVELDVFEVHWQLEVTREGSTCLSTSRGSCTCTCTAPAPATKSLQSFWGRCLLARATKVSAALLGDYLETCSSVDWRSLFGLDGCRPPPWKSRYEPRRYLTHGLRAPSILFHEKTQGIVMPQQ